MNKEKIYNSIEQLAKCDLYDVILVKYLKTKIDKLFEENKQLKEKYLNAVSDYEQEKSKNSKAIEYIENDLQSFLYSIEYKTLLEILKGDSNE